MEEQEGLRTRSFRDEDYNTRRVFLRSYPLQWGSPDDDDDDDDQENQGNKNHTNPSTTAHTKKQDKVAKQKEAIKKIMVTVIEWGGGRVVVLRRLKHKVSFYVITCFPVAFKNPKAFISAP